ncbi:MAG: glycerol dehydratase reactivation factor [Propionibacterium sp.]|nr:glycerol dehydratase reactivation factor [Propionibacterium sp.]
MSADRPTIHLHAHRDVPGAQLTHILLGIEEEDVPVDVTHHDEPNPLRLAQAAALSSRLGLGLGVALDYVVTTTDKLPTERPYIAQHFGRDPLADRTIGSNAARIVKRIPLRGFTERKG